MLPQAILSLPEGVLNNGRLGIDGDTVVLGASQTAYVYVKPPAGWSDATPTAVLTNTDNLPVGAVSISGDTIVLGNEGAAYVYKKPSGGWADMMQTAKLTPSGSVHATFGHSVSVDGNTIAVGAPGGNAGLSGRGYVFVEPATGWIDMTETGQLRVPGPAQGAYAGSGISVDKDTILLGSNGGAAYVFERPSQGWTTMDPSAKLVPADARNGGFSAAVALRGDLAVVGAPGRSIGRSFAAGGAYLFVKPSGGWTNMSGKTMVTGSSAHFYSEFGSSVAVEGKVVVVGAPAAMNRMGAAYIFEHP